MLRQALVQVQFYPSKPGILQRIADVQALREAWTEVDRAETSLAATAAAIPATTTATTGGTSSTIMGYSGGADFEPDRAHRLARIKDKDDDDVRDDAARRSRNLAAGK